MMDTLTEKDLYAQLVIMRGATKNAIMLVEGASDSQAISLHLNRAQVEIVVGHGRNRVENALELANDNLLPDILAVIDSDVDVVLGRSRTLSNAVYSEHYDLEADMFMLPAVAERLLGTFAVAGRTLTGRLDGEDLTASLLRLSATVGRIRVESAQDELGLQTRLLPLHRVVSLGGPILDLRELAQIIYSKSAEPQLSVLEIEEKLVLAATAPPDRKICCGHDLISITSASMRWWGRNVSIEVAAGMLRVAVSCWDFVKLRVYSEVKAWGETNGFSMWTCAF